ncbi:MAG TPA: hypothetical protein VKY54_11425 [Kiloniellales bacterium]|nr:hypothetical protein [Kiloniellales bacterium]
MISVAETSSSLDRAIRALREDEQRLASVIEASAAEIARLRAAQADLLKALARIRLDALQKDQIVGELDDVERRALAAVREQEQKLASLATRREALSLELSAAREGRTTSVQRVSDAAEAIEALEEATLARLAEDVGWQRQAARVAGAEARALAADSKASEAEADRDEKAKPYLEDPLFVYLWERGYGTPAYRGGRIARIGDDYVARVVNYEPARQNYFTLTEIPKRLGEHADRLEAQVEEEEEKLHALERAALEKDGIEERERLYREAEEALKVVDRRIVDLERELADLEKQQAALLGNAEGQGLSGPLDELAAALRREDLQSLLREAAQTPTPEDERIVRRLQETDAALGEQAQQLQEARATVVEVARKRVELERSREDFRRSGYERQGGGFSNDKLIGDVIGGILGGVLSSRALRDAMRSGYRPRGGSRSSRRSGNIFGGFGGRSARGGSRRSSRGGFRTGGGF